MIIKTTRFLLPCKTDEPMILKEQLLKAIKVIRMFPIFILSVPFVLFLLYLKASISYESTIRTILGYMAIGFSFVAIPFIVLCFIFISIYRSLLNYIQKMEKAYSQEVKWGWYFIFYPWFSSHNFYNRVDFIESIKRNISKEEKQCWAFQNFLYNVYHHTVFNFSSLCILNDNGSWTKQSLAISQLADFAFTEWTYIFHS